MNEFKFQNNDVVMFPDTESEEVDVGIGVGLKVAEIEVMTLCRVMKKGNGYGLRLLNYSEAFYKKSGRWVSLKEFKLYFGDYECLKKVGVWNASVVY